MKFFSLIVSSLLIVSCGSPLDEDYWKDHNAEPVSGGGNNAQDGEEVVYEIRLENLYDFRFEFSAESFKKLANGRISVSAEVNYPTNVTLVKWAIESTPCSNYVSPPNYSLGNNDQTTTFSTQKELSAIAVNQNIAIENQYIMLYGTIGTGTAATRMACSPITL